MSAVRRLGAYEELLEASGHHPVIELDVGHGLVPPAFAVGTPVDGAVVFPRRSDHGIPGASVLGTAAGIDALLVDPRVRQWFLAGDFRHLSRPREHHDVVERHLPVGEVGGDWDWMWTRSAPPPVDGEEDVAPLVPGDRDELLDLLARASPRTHGQPFARPTQHWVGVRESGRIVACGAAEPSGAGTPTLAGIAVVPQQRRRGLGAAVTAALTREAVGSVGACALGMFADNDGARILYEALGYTTGMRWRSRWRDGALPSTPTR